MAEKINLKSMRCPTCGANLRAENSTDTITCVYCGNSVVPVPETTAASKNGISALGFNGVLKVEGIKTSSSALAYIEQFFEEYDWEAFAFAQTLSIFEIDKLTSSLKITSADDKNTWFACFKAISVPFLHKVSGCKQILDSIIEGYKKDDLDAYSKFDAYKRISGIIVVNKNQIESKLEKIITYASKYGATSEEIDILNNELKKVTDISVPTIYNNIESIPEIISIINERNAKIVQQLAEQGINAESEYLRAKNLIIEQNYVEALNILLTLNGYLDTKSIVEKINKYYLLEDFLEIEGKLYCFKKASSEYNIFNLYPVIDGEVANKSIIRSISKMVSNYADILYYLDYRNELNKYNLSSNTGEKLYDKKIYEKSVYTYGGNVFLISITYDGYDEKRELVKLDLVSGEVQILLENIEDIISVTKNKMVYTLHKRYIKGKKETATNVINLDTYGITELGRGEISVKGFTDKYIVYTKTAPNAYNKDLYIKSYVDDSVEKLIEKNIFDFCNIISNKLFYYIGNSKNKSLINVNCNGDERKEWPLYIDKLLFEQGGWFYFIRKSGYNSILCKSRLDGSKFSVIATDIEKFVEIINGYLYYINYSSALVKVRMDGSNSQELCQDVEKPEDVLLVKEDKIIFISVDDSIIIKEYPESYTQIVKSIYAVDFTGSGKIKLAYNIKSAQKYDDNTVYYVTEKKITSGETLRLHDTLYKLDVNLNETEKLLSIDIDQPKSGGCYIATCVYGSYDCPQVWTLRRFRDNTLASTWYGRTFIRTYYAISPTIVKWFGNTQWFKNLWKNKLDKMVSNLRSNGVEDTPYQDKDWR